MTIQLPEHLERYVLDQVQAGRYLTEDEVIRDALERHRQAQQQPAAVNHREEQSSQELQRRLLEAGIISEIKPPITDLTPIGTAVPSPSRVNRSRKPSFASGADGGGLLPRHQHGPQHGWGSD